MKTEQAEQSLVYIHAAASISSLGQGVSGADAFTKAQHVSRLSAPIDCYFQGIPLPAITLGRASEEPLKGEGEGTLDNTLHDDLEKTVTAINENYQRIYHLLSQTIDQIIDEQSLTALQLAQTSLFLGSSSMDIGAIVSDDEKIIWLTYLDHLNQYLITKYGLHSLNFTFSTACTSSANALIYACRLLKTGQINKALVIGCEFYNQLTLQGFSCLELLSEKGLHAFSQDRDGMILGEGVGALLLSTQAEGNEQLALLDGYSSCDTYSLTSTAEDGSKIAEVITKALAVSGVSATDINLIKAHGTASPASDRAEVQALSSLFSTKIDALVLKPFIGHTLGACGVLEIALLSELVKQDFMPVPEYAIAKNKRAENDVSNLLWPLVNPNQSFAEIDYILANHCGFGGNNAALVLKNITDKKSNQKEVIQTKPAEIQTLANAQVSYDATITNKILRKQIKQITGFEVRRKDNFTLIALQALQSLFNTKEAQAIDLANAQLGLYGVGDYFSVELLQSLVLSVEQGEDVKPLDFISSVGNSANFYLAKQFDITGVNLFTGASQEAINKTQLLAQSDLALGLVDYAVLVHWQQDEVTRLCQVSLLSR